MEFFVYRGANGNWRWRTWARNGKRGLIVAKSGRSWKCKYDCICAAKIFWRACRRVKFKLVEESA